MCYGCYEEAGKPSIVNKNTIATANLISELYDVPDCGAGGYAHVVTDDWNLEDHHIDFCIEEAEKGSYDLSEEGRQACLKVLKSLRELNEDERYSAMAISRGIIEVKLI